MQTQKMRDDLSLLFVFCLAYFAILVATIFADFKIDSRSICVLNSFIFAFNRTKNQRKFSKFLLCLDISVARIFGDEK